MAQAGPTKIDTPPEPPGNVTRQGSAKYITTVGDGIHRKVHRKGNRFVQRCSSTAIAKSATTPGAPESATVPRDSDASLSGFHTWTLLPDEELLSTPLRPLLIG